MKPIPQLPLFARLIVTALALLACLSGIAAAGRSGFSRLLTEEALAHQDLHSANEAVRLEPDDPEAYYARGELLFASGNIDEAIENFQQSIFLRPHDRLAWLQFGKAFQARGDLAMATSAFAEAVQLSPYYAEPRWYLGNSLLDSGSRKDGLQQLKIAANSDPALLPRAIEIAWKEHGGVASEVLEALDPQTDPARITLASFFVEQNQMKEGLSLLRTAGRAADYDRHRLTVQLIEKNRFRDAAEVFNTGAGKIIEGKINDADFEVSGLSAAPGFSWQFMSEPGSTRITIDRDNPFSGARSLSLIFNGFARADAEFVNQLVLLEPRARYRLDFSSRSQNLESDALPQVAVVEAGPNGRLLVQADPVSSGTADWSSKKIDFETTAVTQAAYVVVRRQGCPRDACPIFGKVWFDTFSLTKI